MFSIKLKTIREEKRLSQRDLAKILGVSQGSVGNWEAGSREPDFKTVNKIADFFNVSADYLLDRNAPSNIEHFTREPAKVEVFSRKEEIESEQKEKAPDTGGLESDPLIAFYGDIKEYLSQDDLDDIHTIMKAKAERNKGKKHGELGREGL